MKRVFFFLVSVLCCATGYSQFDGYGTVGRNNVANRDITAYAHRFEDDIVDISFDSVSNAALVSIWSEPEGKRLKKKDFDRTVVCYDLKNRKTVWSKKISWKEDLFQFGSYYVFETSSFFFDGNEAKLLNGITGEERCDIGRNLYYPYHDAQKGILFNYDGGYNMLEKKSLKNVSLKTGQLLWERKLGFCWSCDFCDRINDSVLIFVASGLHTVNVNDGTGWSYKMKTNVTGSYLDYPYSYDYEQKYFSNLLMDSTSLMLSTINEIAKLDLDGNLLWTNKLKMQRTGLTHLFRNDDYVVLIKKGYIWDRGELKRKGNPCFAVYDFNSGEQYCMFERMKEANYLMDAQIDGDTLYILSSNRNNNGALEKYLLPEGKTLKTLPFDFTISLADKIENLYGFVGKSVYVRVNDSVLEPLVETDPNSVFIFIGKMILKFDRKLTTMEKIDYSDCYVLFKEKNGIRFFGHDDKVVVVTADDAEVATLDLDGIYLSGSKIFSVKDNLLYEIDLEQVLATE